MTPLCQVEPDRDPPLRRRLDAVARGRREHDDQARLRPHAAFARLEDEVAARPRDEDDARPRPGALVNVGEVVVAHLVDVRPRADQLAELAELGDERLGAGPGEEVAFAVPRGRTVVMTSNATIDLAPREDDLGERRAV